MTARDVAKVAAELDAVRRGILVGHSHGRALGLGGHKHPTPILEPIAGHAGLHALNGDWPRTKGYWDALIAKARDSVVFIVWAGNQHLVRFLFAAGAPFDVRLAAHPEVEPISDATLIPETLVRQVFREEADYLDDMLARLKVVPGCTPVVLGTTPPKGDDDKLRQIMLREQNAHLKIWAERIGCSLETVAFNNPLVRRKLWLVVQDLLAESAERAACIFVPVPPDSVDAAGFLKEAYWADDTSHANAAYGALFWSHLFVREETAR